MNIETFTRTHGIYPAEITIIAFIILIVVVILYVAIMACYSQSCSKNDRDDMYHKTNAANDDKKDIQINQIDDKKDIQIKQILPKVVNDINKTPIPHLLDMPVLHANPSLAQCC